MWKVMVYGHMVKNKESSISLSILESPWLSWKILTESYLSLKQNKTKTKMYSTSKTEAEEYDELFGGGYCCIVCFCAWSNTVAKPGACMCGCVCWLATGLPECSPAHPEPVQSRLSDSIESQRADTPRWPWQRPDLEILPCRGASCFCSVPKAPISGSKPLQIWRLSEASLPARQTVDSALFTPPFGGHCLFHLNSVYVSKE